MLKYTEVHKCLFSSNLNEPLNSIKGLDTNFNFFDFFVAGGGVIFSGNCENQGG